MHVRNHQPDVSAPGKKRKLEGKKSVYSNDCGFTRVCAGASIVNGHMRRQIYCLCCLLQTYSSDWRKTVVNRCLEWGAQNTHAERQQLSDS